MKQTIIAIAVCILMISCNTNKKEKEWLQTYTSSLVEFNPYHIDHFPFDITPFNDGKLYVFHDGAAEYNNKVGIILDSKSDSLFFNKTVKALNRRNIKSFSINDDKLICIGDTINDYSHITEGIPIPSFSDVKDQFGLSSNRLNGKEHIYILESKRGEYLEDKDLVKGLKLPNEWKHGFSRGIAIDSVENRLTYWLVLW